MKQRYFTFLGSAWLLLFASAATIPPYYSELGDKSVKDIASDWIVINANKDNTTWEYDSTDDDISKVTGASCGVKYRYDSKNAADDWVVSPPIELSEGVEYVVSYWYKASKADKERMKLMVAESPDASALAAGRQIASYDLMAVAVWTNEELTFVPEKSGLLYFGFHACSNANQWGMYLRGFSIKENKVYPAAPSGLTVTPDAGRALSATLAWELPTTDDNGNPLSVGIMSVKISRDGVPVAELPGDATSWTDASLPGPGVYMYDVSVCIEGAESLPASVKSSWIGPLSAQSLPYDETFSSPDFYTSFWTIVDVDGDASANVNTSYPPYSYAWGWQSNLMGNAHWASIHYPRNASPADNDWLISAPLLFNSAGRYKVSFKVSAYRGTFTGDCTIEVYAGIGNAPRYMTIPCGDPVTSVSRTGMNPNTDGQECVFEFDVPVAGTYYVGLKMAKTKSSSGECSIHLGAFHCEQLSEGAENPMAVVVTSEDNPFWTPVDAVPANLLPGYYHLTAEAVVGDIPDAVLDKAFSDEFIVAKIVEQTNVTFFAEGGSFNSFVLVKADHTPDVATGCVYNIVDGFLGVKFTAPAFNANGGRLYEIGAANVYQGDNLMFTESGCKPGEECSYVIPVQSARSLSADGDYSVSFSNLSGEGERMLATKDITLGVGAVTTEDGGRASLRRIFTISGVEIDAATPPVPGIYIIMQGGKVNKSVVK